MIALTERSDRSIDNEASKKPAWNTTLNDVVDVTQVMGDVSWPALSGSSRVSPKSTSDSSVNSSVVQSPQKECTLTPHSPDKQSTVTPHSPPKKSTTDSTDITSASNHVPVHKSRKRGGLSRNSFVHSRQAPPPLPLIPPFQMPQNYYGNTTPVVSEFSPRETYVSNNWENRTMGLRSPQHITDNHPVLHNASRRNFRPQQFGNGLQRSSYSDRREQYAGNNEWNSPRGSSVIDFHMQPQIVSPTTFLGHSLPNTAPFIPQHVRSFGSPMVTTDVTSLLYVVPAMSPESFKNFPFIPHPPTSPPIMAFPVPDHSLPTLLVNQIDYYFSDANLMKDEFLKSKMDDEGWVSISLIAGFHRVKNLTTNLQLILDSLRSSVVVEVQDDRIRRRNDWNRWISISRRFPARLNSLSPGSPSSSEMLINSLQNVRLGEVDVNKNSADASR